MTKHYDETYERALILCGTWDRSYCRGTRTRQPVLQEFCAYALLRAVPLEDWDQAVYERYIQDTLEGPGDALARMLSEEAGERRRALVELYYGLEEATAALAALPGPAPPPARTVEEKAAALLSPGAVEGLFGISLAGEEGVSIHVSAAAPGILSMLTVHGCGTLLTIGAEADAAGQAARTAGDCLEVCRALGDESRFAIAQALLAGPLTVSEIARQVGLTLPTVNHHLKALMAAGVAARQTGEAPGRGVRYGLNRPNLRQLLRVLTPLLEERP